MDVSKNRGTPKWMVEIMENPIRMDDLGVPLFLETQQTPGRTKHLILHYFKASMGMDRDIEHWGLLGLPTCHAWLSGVGRGGSNSGIDPLKFQMNTEYPSGTII